VRPGAAHRPSFRHELVLHGSTAELLEFAVPFAHEGMAAGESTLLFVRPEVRAALRTVEHLPHVTFLPPLGQPGRGAADLRTTDALLAARTTPTSRVRLLNQEPAVPEACWHEWRRLEAAVNLALSRHGVWAVCAYDRRTLTDEMVDDLHATHQMVGRGDEHRHNDRYQDPVEFISKHMDAPPDPVEASPPSAELLDPSPSTARAAVGAFAINSKLPPHEVENMVLATHEVVTNARLHGRPPVVLRLWVLPGRLTVTVTDTGTGPTNPFLGLLPPDHPHGSGLGLWISHQLVDMTHRRHRDGYTVRLAAAGSCSPAEEHPSGHR
jgi:anti-sigma regulatory factor (Ser/Thr protein kinase)